MERLERTVPLRALRKMLPPGAAHVALKPGTEFLATEAEAVELCRAVLAERVSAKPPQVEIDVAEAAPPERSAVKPPERSAIMHPTKRKAAGGRKR
jgi:hypothetical protein